MKTLLERMQETIKNGYCDDKEAFKNEFEALGDDMKEMLQNSFDQVMNLKENNDEDVDKKLKNMLSDVQKEGLEKIENKVNERIDNIGDDISKKIESEMEKVQNKVGFYDPEIAKNGMHQLQNKVMRNCIEALVNKDISEINNKVFGEKLENAMTTDRTTTPYTGYNTADTFDYVIRHLVTEYGFAAREFETITLQNSNYETRELVTDIASGWVDEGGVVSSGQIVLGKKTFALKKLGVISYFTSELLQEQQIDLMSFIGQRVAENFAKKEDEAFLIGDGTPTYGSFTGLLNATLPAGNVVTMSGTTFTSLAPSDLTDLQLATPQGALNNAKYLMHRSIWNIIVNYRVDAVSAGDGAGAFLYNPSRIINTKAERSFDGYPVVFSEIMPAVGATAADTAFVLFGDFKQSAIRGIRGGIRVLESKDAVVKNEAGSADVNMFTTDREAIRWTYQVGYLAVIPKDSSNNSTQLCSMSRLKTAAASA